MGAETSIAKKKKDEVVVTKVCPLEDCSGTCEKATAVVEPKATAVKAKATAAVTPKATAVVAPATGQARSEKVWKAHSLLDFMRPSC